MRTKKKLRIRKSIRCFYLAIAIVLFICSCGYILSSFVEKRTIAKNEEIYNYTNKFNYSYVINLIENKYIDEPTLEMSENAYVTDLIDSIDLKIVYEYQGSKESLVKYNYEILGTLQGVYTYNGNEQRIWTKEYDILQKQEKESESGNIIVDENINLDLSAQNLLVKEFEQQMSMSIDAKFILMIKINTSTSIEEENVTNAYTIPIQIDLGKKTTTVTGENNQEETKYISKQVEVTEEVETLGLIISIIVLLVAISIYRYVLTKTQPINKIKNAYKYELNRILRLCQDKIVQVSTQVDVTSTNIIDVKDFGEIIKVSEELFKPILYWASKETDEAWFYVMSNSVTYRYILKG